MACVLQGFFKNSVYFFCKRVLRSYSGEQVRPHAIYTCTLYIPISWSHLLSSTISLCPRGRFFIMCRFAELLPLPCPSHKTMMSWYSRDKQCQLQLVNRMLFLSLSVCVSALTIKHKGMDKSYNT